MRKSIAVAAIAASAATSACSKERIEDAGPTVSRNYQVGDFKKIEVAGPYAVEVRTGANPDVSASGPEKLLDRTVVKVEGDKLVIRPEREKGWFSIGWSSNGKATFKVTVPQLSAATIAGSGDIAVDRVTGNSFEGTVAGSGGLNLGSAEVQNLKFSIAGSGDAKTGSGSARSAEYDIAGSGGIEASRIATQQLKVSIAGSGSVRGNSSGPAKVDIMGSGDVEIGGGAQCSVSKTGSGSVHCS